MEARNSTGPGKLLGEKAVSPKLYSSRVTADGPAAPGSGTCPNVAPAPAMTRMKARMQDFVLIFIGFLLHALIESPARSFFDPVYLHHKRRRQHRRGVLVNCRT